MSKGRLQANQYGLASVEMVLLMPMILMLMYIMVHSAKTMLVYGQRTIESRNAAYAVELYNGGKPTFLDELRHTADKAVSGIEQELVDTIDSLESFGININNYVDGSDLEILQKFPIQRYATVSEDSTWFYNSMLRITRDEMDEYADNDDPDLMTDRVKNLTQILDNDYSKSGVSVGVSVSAFTGALGVFHPFTGKFFMRDYHAADFAKKLDLTDISINSEEVIADDYNLKAGYSVEMKEMLNPEIIFNQVFAGASEEPLETPGIFDLPLPVPLDPTVGIVSGEDSDYDYSECTGFYPGTTINIPMCQPGDTTRAGRWLDSYGNQGAAGDSYWTPDAGTPRAEALAAAGASSIEFIGGFPVFEPLAYSEPGTNEPAIVQVAGMTGRASYETANTGDFWKADRAYRELIGDPTWMRPRDYTWHHHEDCQTMVLVPTPIHGRGLRHEGGASYLNQGIC